LFDIHAGWVVPFDQRTKKIRRNEGDSMKRPVSLLASLAVALGTLAACGAEAAVGKDQLATICGEKTGGSVNCACFADALETSLAPEQFAKVAKAIDENRRYTGFVPGEIANDASLGGTVTQAQLSCAA
jgi:hypothetical protein